MRCKNCGTNKYDKERLVSTEDGYICPECLTRYYRRCTCCGSFFKYKTHYHMQCDKCESQIYKNNLNSYGTKPFPKFVNFGKDTRDDLGCRYYGLEMEFSYTDPDVIHKSMKNIYDRQLLYNKSDSSLSRGVEIVTSPLDKKSLVSLLKEMESTGFKKVGTDYSYNAGLHIHVNKNTIDAIDRYKLSMLLNKKCTELEMNIIFYLSNRNTTPELIGENHHYCSVGSGTKYNYKCDRLDRHIALNVGNTETFEFRIFKSSNDIETILSYVYMVDSMIDFCHNNGIKDINITNYIVYIKNKNENKMIIDKIEEFESLHGEFIKEENVIYSRTINSLLNGIKWYEYYKLLSYIDNDSCNDTRCLASTINKFKRDIKNGVVSHKLTSRYRGVNKTSRMCINTIKKVLINKIMKEANKCA